MSMKRVAILQNQFRVSGRTRVLCEVIDLLNEQGIIPDLLTFTPESVGQEAARTLGYDHLRFDYNQVAPVPFKRGWLLQIILMNQLTYHTQKSYDLVFNSNNTLHGLNPDGNFLHYIYYPIAITTQELKHFAEYSSSGWRQIYGALLGLWLGRKRPVTPSHVYGISRFSQEAILRIYPFSHPVGIIYPPSVYGNINTNKNREQACVSTGSFTDDKRQLDQLQIARHLPNLTFNIVGTVKSKPYFQACQKYIEREGLTNVRLWPDLPFQDLQNLLNTSQFFLHTKHDEHFGISTVEAISAGCIPVVHDSGGQKEVVPFSDLRFDQPETAVEILKSLCCDSNSYKQLQSNLQQHIVQFGNQHFREQMLTAIQKAINLQ